MAWASKKQYAILMESDEGKDLVARLPDMEQDEFQQEFGKFLGKNNITYSDEKKGSGAEPTENKHDVEKKAREDEYNAWKTKMDLKKKDLEKTFRDYNYNLDEAIGEINENVNEDDEIAELTDWAYKLYDFDDELDSDETYIDKDYQQSLQDKKINTSYLFPELDDDDLAKAKEFGLEFVETSDEGTKLQGKMGNIKKFANEHLDYELQDDYFGDYVDTNELEKKNKWTKKDADAFLTSIISPDAKKKLQKEGKWDKLVERNMDFDNN